MGDLFRGLVDGFRRHRVRYLYWSAVVLVFLLAVVAFVVLTPRTSVPSNLFLDSVFRSLQLFLLNLDMGTIGEVPVLVYLLALIAAVLSAFGALALVFSTARHWAVIRWQARGKAREKRAVLLGFGRVNRAAARALQRAGYQVTAADLAFDDAARRLAAVHGVVPVAADLTDPDSLAPLQLDKAGRVIVAIGDDIANVELGSSLIREGGPQVFIHVTDVQLAASLRQLGRHGVPFLRLGKGADAPGRGWIFSLKEEGARRLMAQAQLPLLARSAGQPGVHLVIIGFGDQGRAVALEALLDATAIDLAPPRITVIDRRADELEAQFRALRPRLMDDSLPEEARPDIAFVPADAGALDMASDSRMADIEARGRPTAYVVCCGEDAVNLDAGLRLEQAMRRSQRLAAPIYLALRGAGLRLERAGVTRGADLLRTFGNIDDAVAEAPLLATDPDAAAIRLNGAYDSQALAAGLLDEKDYLPEPESWAALPETMRESNRRAVRHARTKLLDLGFRWRNCAAPGLPRIDSATAGHLKRLEEGLDYQGIDSANVEQATPEATLLAKSVLAEHRRWLIDRAMDDWRQMGLGETRSNQRRIHRNMVPFAGLTPRNKRFDIMFIRALLAYLSEPPPKGVPATLVRRDQLFLTTDGAVPATIDAGVTDLALAWSSDVSDFSPPAVAAVGDAIRAWAAGPQASRLDIYLGRPASGSAEKGRVAPAELIRRIVEALDPAVTLEVIHLYGLGVSEVDPGVPDDVLLGMLRRGATT